MQDMLDNMQPDLISYLKMIMGNSTENVTFCQVHNTNEMPWYLYEVNAYVILNESATTKNSECSHFM